MNNTRKVVEGFDISVCEPNSSKCASFPTIMRDVTTCGDKKTVVVDRRDNLEITRLNPKTGVYDYVFKGDETGYYCIDAGDLTMASPDAVNGRNNGFVWGGRSWYCPAGTGGYKGYCFSRQLPQANCSSVYNGECRMVPLTYTKEDRCKILDGNGGPKCVSTRSDRVCEFVYDRGRSRMSCERIDNV